MDKRELACLFVFEGKVSTVELRGRDALVVALQVQLCQSLKGNICANDLRLFLARRGGDSDSKWLLHESPDAQTLALGRDPAVAEATAARYFTRRCFMESRKPLMEYFPVQPPIYDGVSTAIHVLVCHKHTRVPQPLVAAREREMESPGWANLLVHSLVNASSETAIQRRPAGARNMPAIIRCANDVGILWLDDEDDGLDKSSIYISSPWRQLSTEVFKWAIANNGHRILEQKGRRAILTGAPRVGKSAFIGFVIFQLLKLRVPPVCILDVPGITFARIDPIRATIDEGARGKAFQVDLMDQQTVYIYDVCESMADLVAPLSAKEVYARSVIVLPQHYVPKSSSRTKTFVLPMWTMDEIRELVFSCRPSLSVPRVTRLVHKWGGVLGRVVTHDTDCSEAQLESALSQITERKAKVALARLGSKGDWDAIAQSDDGESWRALVVARSNADDGFVNSGEVAFTSQYVCDHVLALTTQRTWTIRERLPPPSRLRSQLVRSLEYLAQEEEEKNETPWALASRRAECRWEHAWV